MGRMKIAFQRIKLPFPKLLMPPQPILGFLEWNGIELTMMNSPLDLPFQQTGLF